MRSLHSVGLHVRDVEIISLAHQDGVSELAQKRVDAWVGVDPYAAQSQLENGSRVLFANRASNSFGFVTVTESFALQYPELLSRIVRAYQNAHNWAERHPGELVPLYARASRMAWPVASLALGRGDYYRHFSAKDLLVLKSDVLILQEEGLVEGEGDLPRVVDELASPGLLP